MHRAPSASFSRRLVRNFRTSSPRKAIYENVCELVGKTPVVKINKLAPEHVELYAKLEYFNPLSSVKDRLALAIIEDAEKKGALKPGQTVVEASSGNTGIALAMVCAAKGYPFVCTMAESFSVERRKVMRGLGAKVIVTPAPQKGTGMVKKAAELAEEHGWFLASQFDNEANWAYHANTTGPEILVDFSDRQLDYYVTGFGTGGTFTGASQVIKQARPDCKVILSEPANAAMVSSGEAQVPGESHPAWEPHPIQGWSPDFIPGNLQTGLGMDLVDEIVPIGGEEAIQTSKALATQEGIFTGISGGATTAAALKVCEKAAPGSVVLCMIPDTAERYLSTPLFADILAEMNEEEEKISKSTPSAQLPPPEDA